MQHCLGWEGKGLCDTIKSIINVRELEEALEGHAIKNIILFTNIIYLSK